jgi:hypothetical protein
MSNAEVYRPRSSYFFAGAIYFICLGIIGQSFFTENTRGILTTTSWALVISYLFHLGFIRPKVTFFDEGITITNPTREITVGWDCVSDINAKYSMFVQVGGEKIYAWAAQAPGRYHARTIHPTEIRGMKIPDTYNMRPGESPRTHSGVAVALARIRLDAFRSRENQVACAQSTHFNRNGVITLVLLFAIASGLSIF